MKNELISTYMAFAVIGLFVTLTKEKYLKNLTNSLNRYRLFKLDPKITVRLLKIFGPGLAVAGVLGILASLFKWNI